MENDITWVDLKPLNISVTASWQNTTLSASLDRDSRSLDADVTDGWRNATLVEPLASDVTFYTLAVILGVFSIAGIIMNTMNIITFRTFPSLRTSSNIRVEAMMWNDLFMAGFCNPVVVICLFCRRWIFGDTFVIMHGFVATFLGLFSVHLICTISIDRYHAVVNPSSQTNGIRTAVRDVACSALCALFWAVAPLCGWNFFRLEGLQVSSAMNWVVHNNAERAYICCLFVFCFFTPILIIIVTYSYILYLLHSIAHRLQSHDPNQAAKNDKQKKEAHVAKVMFYVMASFLGPWTPYAIVSMTTAFNGPVVEGVLATLPGIVAKTAVVWNPLIFAWHNHKFRQSLKQLLAKFRSFRTSPDAPAAGSRGGAGGGRSLGRKRDSRVKYSAEAVPVPQSPLRNLRVTAC